jgi:O-antigen ligase
MAAEATSAGLFLVRLRNGILIALLVAAPWAFATIHELTQIAIKVICTLLAATLLLKPRPNFSIRDVLLAGLTIAILLFGLVSIFNRSIPFLPATIDPSASAFTLWGCAGIAAIFWAARDWQTEDPSARRKLIGIMLINGALIAAVAMLQRISAPNKVLWIYRPDVITYFYVFGPFEYRATASQFFNLLWPIALGLYIESRLDPLETRRFPLPLVVLLMAAPIVTSSRGGMVMFFFAGAIFLAGLFLSKKISPTIRLRLLLITLGVTILFACFGVAPLERRLNENHSLADFLSLQGRLKQNQNSWRIVADHPLWGVGPGAYETAFRLYQFPNAFKPDRNDPREQKAWDFFYAKAHNDWLQTLAEWGAPATLAIILAILVAWVELLARGKTEPILRFGMAVSILSLLLHGAFDYPLQNLAILIYLATLLGLGKSAAPASPLP